MRVKQRAQLAAQIAQGDVIHGVGSVAVTSNHWSVPVMSCGYVMLGILQYVEKATMGCSIFDFRLRNETHC